MYDSVQVEFYMTNTTDVLTESRMIFMYTYTDKVMP